VILPIGYLYYFSCAIIPILTEMKLLLIQMNILKWTLTYYCFYNLYMLSAVLHNAGYITCTYAYRSTLLTNDQEVCQLYTVHCIACSNGVHVERKSSNFRPDYVLRVNNLFYATMCWSWQYQRHSLGCNASLLSLFCSNILSLGFYHTTAFCTDFTLQLIAQLKFVIITPLDFERYYLVKNLYYSEADIQHSAHVIISYLLSLW